MYTLPSGLAAMRERITSSSGGLKTKLDSVASGEPEDADPETSRHVSHILPDEDEDFDDDSFSSDNDEPRL